MMIDIFFALVAAWGFYLGFSRGIIKTIFTILSVVFGLIMAVRFGPQVTKLLESALSDNPLMFIAGFLITFVGVMMIIRLYARFLDGALQSAHINFINQFIGGFFTAAFFTLLFSGLLWFGDKAGLIEDQTKDDSATYAYLEQYPQLVWRWGGSLKPILADFWDHSIEFLDKLEKMSVEREESDPNVYDLPDDEPSRR